MNFRRSIVAGTLALTTVVTAGPLTAVASAQTDPAPSSTVPVVDCARTGNRYVRVARRLNMAQNRLLFWQRVAAEMPARIDTQKATIADLEAQLAAATGDAATALQTQLDQATEKLAWMEAKLAASGRRVPFWTDYVAKVTVRLTTISDTATGAACTLPTTTTIPFDTSLPAGERPPHTEHRERHGDDGPTTTVDPNAPTTTEAPETEHEGPDDRRSPNTTVPANAAPQAQAEAQRRFAEAQRRAAEAQRRAAQRQQRRSSSTTAAGQQQRPPRDQGGQPSTSGPAPTFDDHGGSSGGHGSDG